MMIKGQEVRLTFTSTDSGLLVALSDVVSFSWEIGTKTIEQALLGETSNRVDEIYEKTTGNVELRFEGPEYFDFLDFVTRRAQRRIPASSRVDAAARFTFSDGRRRLVIFRDLKFGPMGVEAGSRDDFVGSTFEWATSEIPRYI